MTEREIRQRIEKIKKVRGDAEKAHGEEDQLRWEFITYVAETYMGSLATKARLVLSTSKIRFGRWDA